MFIVGLEKAFGNGSWNIDDISKELRWRLRQSSEKWGNIGEISFLRSAFSIDSLNDFLCSSLPLWGKNGSQESALMRSTFAIDTDSMFFLRDCLVFYSGNFQIIGFRMFWKLAFTLLHLLSFESAAFALNNLIPIALWQKEMEFGRLGLFVEMALRRHWFHGTYKVRSNAIICTPQLILIIRIAPVHFSFNLLQFA